jgi:hypothetical protein
MPDSFQNGFLRFRQLIFFQKSPKTFKFGRKKIFFGITLKLKGRLWQNIYQVSIKEDGKEDDRTADATAGLTCAAPERANLRFCVAKRIRMAGFMQGVDNRPVLSY